MAVERAPLIVADVFEERNEIAERLRQLGAHVETAALRSGDYVVNSDTLVERKTVSDLHASLVQGRFWSQVGGVREACRYPYLLVEGGDLDEGPVSLAAIRGVCLAAIRLGVRLLRTTDARDSALWLYRLASRTGPSRRPRPAYSQSRQACDVEDAAEAMLAAVPGISTSSARALLRRFGSVAAVVGASPTELMTVRGIGRKRAHLLAEVTRASVVDASPHAASRSQPCCERPGRAT